MQPLLETYRVTPQLLIVLIFLRAINVSCVQKPADIGSYRFNGLPTKTALILIPHVLFPSCD
jgi:hypothetical protein